ncbi:aminoglycoside phosphotransferase family protein [Nocardia gipuzkoensis]|uniref:aminoglycoside phosphotransferase family protein n=1 Tax=Nocardia gipuzkoensis TaxID=2749991 RepID=UPI0015EF7229|nr:aminoglycoside phosphotransferase family protein [Nocardia gipuzkoensis]
MFGSEGTASRIEWHELPQPVRTGIEARLGAPVRSAVTQTGGYSHGAAVRLLLNDGRRAFAKVINCDDKLCGMYQTEARTAARLPPTVPTPAVQFTAELAGWFVMVFDDVAGRHPRLDKPAELDAVLTAVEQLANVLTPSPIPDVPAMADSYGPKLNCWRHFAEHGPPVDLDSWSLRNLDRLAELESTWPEATDGTTLLHTDLRPDNMLLRPDGTVVVIDWAWPCVGAAWLELVSLAPSIAASGIDPDPVLATHPVTRTTDSAAVDAFLCALVGYWVHSSRMPPPPHSPKLRRHQACSAQVSGEWLRRRLAWP